MAPLTAADLLTPNGDLDVSWFAPMASADVSAFLTKQLADGYALVGTSKPEQAQNDAARAWAYYKAYGYIASDLARKPKSFTVSEQNDTATRAYSTNDASFFLQLSLSWKQVFDALVPAVVDTGEHRPSVSVRHRTTF